MELAHVPHRAALKCVERQLVACRRQVQRVKWRKAALVAGAVMGSAGAVQQALTVRDRRRFPPPPGLLVNVDGHPIRLKVRGRDVDEPTVVLRREWVCFSPNWHWFQEEIAPNCSKLAYDRAGLG